MEIHYHKDFEKRFRKLTPNIKSKVLKAIEKFISHPNHPTLRNHPLTGGLRGRRAFSVTGDIRIIFREYDNYTVVIFLDVGTHNQVYK